MTLSTSYACCINSVISNILATFTTTFILYFIFILHVIFLIARPIYAFCTVAYVNVWFNKDG